MPPGQPHVARASYARIKLRAETHLSWVKMKRLCHAKSDDDFTRDLLAHFMETIASKKSTQDSTDTSCNGISNNSVTQTAEMPKTIR